MKALLLQQPGSLICVDMPECPPPGPGEAKVALRAAGICGTDIHAFHGRQPFFEFPRILGHELAVEVLEIGEGVSHLRRGDLCCVEPYFFCGCCGACSRGKTNCCESMRVFGVHVDGGFREEFLVPADKLHPSRHLTPEQLAAVEPLAIGFHGVQRAAPEPGEQVLVVGAGPIGLAAALCARAMEAHVSVIDVSANRRAFTRDVLGLESVLAPEEWEAQKCRPSVVIDATGNTQAMEKSFTLPAHGGRLVFLGLVTGRLSFEDAEFHRRELTVLASRNALPEDFPRLIQEIETGRIHATAWITHRADFRAGAENLPVWASPGSNVVKAILTNT